MKCFFLLLLILTTTVLLKAQQSNAIYLGGGYAYSLPAYEMKKYNITAINFRDPETGQLRWEYVRPRLAEGPVITIGYQCQFKSKWTWFTELSYLEGVSWTRKRFTSGSTPFYWRTTRAQSYRLHGGVSIEFGNPNRHFVHRKWRNIYHIYGIGVSFNHSQILTTNESKEPQTHSRYYKNERRIFRGIGYAGFLQAALGYNISATVFLQLQLRMEVGYYQSQWYQESRFSDNSKDNRPHIRKSNLNKYPMHHLLSMLSVGYRF